MLCIGIDSPKKKFPRKKVIHGQLPLPMPCYDLVPVTDPTFTQPEICDFGLEFLSSNSNPEGEQAPYGAGF